MSDLTLNVPLQKQPLEVFYKKETLAQVFSCEFYEIYKESFFTKHLWMAASASGSSLNKSPSILSSRIM